MTLSFIKQLACTILTVSLIAIATGIAQAQVGLSFSPTAAIAPGGTSVLAGEITNSGTAAVYFNGLSYQFFSAPAGAITDPNDPNVALNLVFDSNLPFFLPGTTDPAKPTFYSGSLFDVVSDSGAPLGNYGLSLSLLGGANSFDPPTPSYDLLATANATQSIMAPVPEAGTGFSFGLILLLSGMIAFSAWRRGTPVRTELNNTGTDNNGSL